MDIVDYYGYSGAFANFIVWISLFSPSAIRQEIRANTLTTYVTLAHNCIFVPFYLEDNSRIFVSKSNCKIVFSSCSASTWSVFFFKSLANCSFFLFSPSSVLVAFCASSLNFKAFLSSSLNEISFFVSSRFSLSSCSTDLKKYTGFSGFHKALSCSRWWSTCSYQSEKIMFILFIICSSDVI